MHRTLVSFLLPLPILLLGLCPGEARAEARGLACGVEIEFRTDPLSGGTTVTANGSWPVINQNILAELVETPTAAEDFLLEISGSIEGLTAIDHYERTVPLPSTLPGEYSLAVVLVYEISGQPDTSIECGSVSFRIPEPIPTLEAPVLAVLVVILLAAGWILIGKR